MRLRITFFLAASLLIFSGSLKAQTSKKSGNSGNKQPQLVEKSAPQSSKQKKKSVVSGSSETTPASAAPKKNTKMNAQTAESTKMIKAESTSVSGKPDNQKNTSPEWTTKNVDLKPSAGSKDQKLPTREEQIRLKKQKYAESLKSRGFPESEVSKMVNSKFPEEKSGVKQ